MHRKLDELVHRNAAKAAGVTVIKRFSGGGTVAVDSDTVFATLISSEAAIPEVGTCVPLPIFPRSTSRGGSAEAACHMTDGSGLGVAASPSELVQSCKRQVFRTTAAAGGGVPAATDAVH